MKTFSTIILFLVTTLLFAQTYPDEKALDANWEQWQDKVPVSGNVRVGLMLDQEEKDFDPSSFYVLIPETETANLCVELSSKDGRYSANINYDISELQSGIQEFVLPTKYKSELEDYSANEVVILSTLSQDCEGEVEAYLVSGWLETVESKSVSVYVNSMVPTSVIVEKKDNDFLEFKCSTVEFPKVAYSKKCTIPIEDYNSASKLIIKERIGRGNRTNFMKHKMIVKPIKL
ncbi:hypothetical protein [Winogradskyella sp. Asnod2-B02-A]|uniref:hypothetical protein n=1 Tax=Winogradskyella sp. Asnod2-B02-A TaxID=3160583 RepID=UPI00386BC325